LTKKAKNLLYTTPGRRRRLPGIRKGCVTYVIMFRVRKFSRVTSTLASLSKFDESIVCRNCPDQSTTSLRTQTTDNGPCHVSGNFLPFKGKCQSLSSQALRFFSFAKGKKTFCSHDTGNILKYGYTVLY
jgi:hypothetical protein